MDAVVVAARRTPVGTAGSRRSGLADVAVHDLAAPVLRALTRDVRGAGVDDVVLGCARGPGGDTARVAALAAGLGDGVPGLTVDRQCGSGLEAVRLAAALVSSRQAACVLAGGAESASTGPGGRAAFAPPGWPDPPMGEAAEALAAARNVSRARQDAYAARSHARTLRAVREGVFDPETVAVGRLVRDERPRPGLDVARLARFPGAFGGAGTVTAGNACGVGDGAAAVAVVSEAVRSRLGLPGLAVRSSAVVGVDPALPGLGAAPAVEAALSASGLRLADVGVLELTEAFAAQVLACTDALGLDPLGADADRVCPDGGAIGMGHPWGASGALVVVRLFSAMVRRPGPRFGVAACAVGGGQGVAVVVERVGPASAGAGRAG